MVAEETTVNKAFKIYNSAGLGRVFLVIIKKHIDFSEVVCYNKTVAWRDGRVGLRRTTGNRVNPNTVSRVRIPFSPPK